MPTTITLGGEYDHRDWLECDFMPVDLQPPELFMVSEDFIKLDGHWGVLLNDTWYWAGSDFEEIPDDEYRVVAELYRKFGRAGLFRWVYGRRGYFPAFDDCKDMIQAVLALEELHYDRNGQRLK